MECSGSREDIGDNVLNTPFTEEEVRKVLLSLKNNKACGVDEIINEFLKAASDVMLTLFTKFFNVILLSGKVPEIWSVGLIKPIYKNKGSDSDPHNYRGISLLSCFSKVFTGLLNQRLADYLNTNTLLGQEQAGFRSGYGVNDHIFTLHSLINFFLFKKQKLYAAFIDYEKAFDYVDRALLWQKLTALNINGNILVVIKDLYEKAKSCIICNDNMSDFFTCPTGVRQGENLSPLLFSIFWSDLKSYISDHTEGLDTVKNAAEQLRYDEISIDQLCKCQRSVGRRTPVSMCGSMSCLCFMLIECVINQRECS